MPWMNTRRSVASPSPSYDRKQGFPYKGHNHLILLVLRRTRFLTFSGAEKEAKRHPPIPSPSLYGRGVIDSGQRPPSIKVLVWLSSFRPCGVRHVFIGWRIRTRDGLLIEWFTFLEGAEEGLVERGFGEGILILELRREIDAVILTDVANRLRR